MLVGVGAVLLKVEEEVVPREVEDPCGVGVAEPVEVAVVHVVGAVHRAVGGGQVVALW